jgi:non-specific serine/threonine protein kinase
LIEGRYWLERVLAADHALTPVRVAALSAYTRVLITQSDHAAAGVNAADCLDLARRLDDPRLVTLATQDLGMHLLLGSSDLAHAQEVLADGVARFGGVDDPDPTSVAMTQQSLAMALLYRGDVEQAGRLCAEIRAFCQARGDRWWQAYTLCGSAMVAMAAGDPDRAVGYVRESLALQLQLGDMVGAELAVDLMSRAVAAQGDHERAARLAGAGHRIRRELGQVEGAHSHPETGRDLLDLLCAELGPRTFEAAYQRGWEVSADQTIAFALGEDTVSRPARPGAPPSGPLTAREREVAELIAEGLSNREIGTRLTISQRTAESHVENILRKLGLTSRTQIAVWVFGGHTE